MEEHPLFTRRDEDEEAPRVVHFHVKRFEKSGPVWCPMRFKGEEIRDLSELYDRFGGGSYELVAYNEKGISAKRLYTLPGPSKALVEGTAAETPAAAAAPFAPRAAESKGFDWSVLIPVLVALGPSLVQMIISGRQQEQQMLLAMMNGSKQDAQTFMQAMQQQSAATQQTMATLFAEIAKAKSGGGGASAPAGGLMDVLMQGMEMGADLTKRGGGDSESSLTATIGGLAQLATASAQQKAAEAELAKAETRKKELEQGQPPPQQQQQTEGGGS